MVRVLWNLENPIKECFQNSFEAFEKMYDEKIIDGAIENSLERANEKKAAVRAVEMLALYSKNTSNAVYFREYIPANQLNFREFFSW